MHKRDQNRTSRLASTIFGIVLAALYRSSCESIYEDLAPCSHGVSLRFVYDYNMEYANAFPKKVDCLTLLIYDSGGNYVGMRTVTGPELQDETYRMQLDLEPGRYRFIAYGGMACDERSFAFVQPAPGKGVKLEETTVIMDADLTTSVREKLRLHDLFWGSLTLETADLYNEGTVEMMKNTNNIRIVLQQMNGEPVKDKDFDFSITDDNTLFAASNNDLLPNGTVTYTPWAQGQASTGITDDGQEVIVAYAEFSTSRLMVKNSPKLIIRRASDGNAVINIPLNNYLLLLKSELYEQMKPQEFLDRESEWSLFFFLDENGAWIKTYIKINDWTIRVNNMDM